MAIGCSTNSVLHLLAIANEAGVPLELETLNELSGKVPNICHLAPAGWLPHQCVHEMKLSSFCVTWQAAFRPSSPRKQEMKKI